MLFQQTHVPALEADFHRLVLSHSKCAYERTHPLAPIHAIRSCNYDDPPIDVAYLHQYTRNRAKAGLIDPLNNLQKQKLYLYIGTHNIAHRLAIRQDF